MRNGGAQGARGEWNGAQYDMKVARSAVTSDTGCNFSQAARVSRRIAHDSVHGVERMSSRLLLTAIAAWFLSTAALAQTTAVPTPSSPPSASRVPLFGKMDTRTRMKRCGFEWKQAKLAGHIPPGQKWWPYWNACNARLKRGDH